MPGSNEVGTFVRGAEQAEARGDHAAAEQLLRRALVLQEFSLGEQHPEVANTLNNLAIVCEMNGKLSDAEACYRRAYSIATSSLPPGDPFVTTSRDNLEQFCKARGVPFREPTPPAVASSPPARRSPQPLKPAAPGPQPLRPQSAPSRATPPRPSSAPPRSPSPSAQPLRPPAPHPATSDTPAPVRAAIAVPAARESSRLAAIIVPLVAILALLAAGWYLFYSNRAPDTAATEPSSSSQPDPVPAATPPPAREVEPVAPPAAREAEPVTPPPAAAPQPAAPPPAPVAAEPEPPAPTTRASPVKVVSAQACRSLRRTGAWQCVPAGGSEAPGTLYFYTRVASPRDTTIEHRWYRDDQLHQRVRLRIRANPSGFRTYSQTRISPDRTGMWKVELRTQDNQLLDEKTFAVK